MDILLIEKTMSVRELAELARSGDIDFRSAASVKAAEGARLHRLLQSLEGGEYETEVTLRAEWERGGVRFRVAGRADGVITGRDGSVTVDEIKTTMKSVAKIAEDDYGEHWAQAACYARMYCERESLSGAAVRLTYYQADTGETRRFTRAYTYEELREYVDGLLDRCVRGAVFEYEWRGVSRPSMSAAAFPFEEFRSGQRKLAGEVYRAARDGRRLYAAAPTGTGKTISALFPAVRALGDGYCSKVFYLTAKETARQVAADAVSAMAGAGLRAKTVVLTAKDKICPMAERRCDPESCERARGHYDRVGDAVISALEGADFLGRSEVAAAAAEYCVCPFEFSLDIATLADIIVCDYNYVFDPKVNLKRFFAEGGDFLVLADEAHNLPSRARDMYSCELSKAAVLKARRVLPKSAGKLKAALGALNKKLLDIGKQLEDESVSEERPEGLDTAVMKVCFEGGEFLSGGNEAPEAVNEAYWACLDYMRTTERWGANYAAIARAAGREVTVKLYCADPSEYIAATLELTRAAVFFSATLTPPEYYAKLLGGGEEPQTLSLPSPFPRENFLPLVADFVSTRYRDRDFSRDAVAEMIFACAAARRGNYIAFFPSYKYMSDVHERFAELFPEMRTARQSPGMGTAAREAFLREFEALGEGLVGFCVMGGIFAEGVDFAGERAVGVIVVGTGLPGIDAESELLRRYFDENGGAGYEYAYVFPGMNRVLQAAGRVIRSGTDRGIALLIDDRFAREPYPALFPAHWAHRRRVGSARELGRELERFWVDGK
ncbi:MAG: ATP-dependent DNA helicase [Oscillospiraceae bacterium]|jgi:Rad3-related DNA helicase|nr:ATP-dependent DNA helicase [Oscillospiraceae bacterium]